MLTTLRRIKFINMIYMVMRDVVSYFKYRRQGSFSQHGEDTIIQALIGGRRQGFYVDIGGSHPFRINNTYALYRAGWSGVVVDPIPHFRWLYRIWRSRDTFLNVGIGRSTGNLTYYEMMPSVLSTFDKPTVDKMIEEDRAKILRTYAVDVLSVNDMLAAHTSGKQIDLLSIDVEGLDYEILSALDFDRFLPAILCVEFNSPEEFSQLEAFLTTKGYRIHQKTACNVIALAAETAKAPVPQA